MNDRIIERAEVVLDLIEMFQRFAHNSPDPKVAADWTLAVKNSASALHSLVQAARNLPKETG